LSEGYETDQKGILSISLESNYKPPFQTNEFFGIVLDLYYSSKN